MRYEQDPLIVTRKIGSELILIPVRQNVGDLQYLYTLNGVASYIWELIDGGRTVEDMAQALIKKYEVEAPQAEADVVEFLAQMKEIGAVVERPEGD